MIVADTGAIIALLDTSERHHAAVLAIFEANPRAWVFPWAVLPEVDYMLGAHVGRKAQNNFLADISSGALKIEGGTQHDLVRANDLHAKHGLGLVDGVVIAVAERLRAAAIATLDMRHFASVAILGRPKLLPRDAD